jgi:cobalt transporter subunit CbtB
MEAHDISLGRTKTLSLPSWLSGAVSLFLAGAVVYVALFSSYPAVHNAMHTTRHSLAIVPCH